jgi:hypothetical protein
VSRTIVQSSALVVALLLAVAGCDGMQIGNPSTNLIKSVSPTRDVVSGYWEVAGGRLQGDATPHARIAMPVVPHGDYELTLRCARIVGQGSLDVVLPVGDRQVLLVVADRASDGVFSGLELVGGERSGESITSEASFDFVNNRVYDVAITVRTIGEDAKIAVDVDDRPFIRWIGPIDHLSLPGEWSLPASATLAVGSDEAMFQFRSILMRTVPAEKTWLN